MIIDGTPNDDALVGTPDADSIRGFDGNDTLVGENGNDTLDGGNGNDLISMGDGDDSLNSIGDGNDTIFGGNGNDYVWTFIGDDEISGEDGNDTLFGDAGNDTIFGGNGIDSVIGGVGNDLVDMGLGTATQNGVAMGGTGQDTLIVDFSNSDSGVLFNSVLAAVRNQADVLVMSQGEFEVFSLLGTAFSDTFTGGELNDTLRTAGGDDTIIAGAGDDLVNGGDGTDSVSVGAGNDTVEASSGNDSVYGGEGDDLINSSTDGGTNYGEDGNDAIFGSSANDFLLGGAGQDSLLGEGGDDMVDMGTGLANSNGVATGGDGNDTLVVDFSLSAAGVAFDSGNGIVTNSLATEIMIHTGFEVFHITGSNFNDTITASAANETLRGGTGDDFLNGEAGVDTMFGGAGNDTYVVDNPGDIVNEGADGGIDTVQSSINRGLNPNQENLVLTGVAAINGSGNSLNNRITGNAANNIINGGTGADTMFGGAGDDTFVVDNPGDIVNESPGGGIDTVQSSINRGLNPNQENLLLTGTDSINGSGNSENNRITGNSGKNILNGGAGNDTMLGGLGDDTYVVDAVGDVVTEAAAAGTDTIQSSVTLTLPTNVEKLTLTGVSALTGVGNSLGNVITGNGADNPLFGGPGRDLLVGGAGADRLFGAALGVPNGAAEIDTLTGGLGNDVFILGTNGPTGVRLYDGNAAGAGLGGYALITDFSVGDKLQIKGAASQYRLGASPVGLPAGQGLYHDTNANGVLNPAIDELIAVIQGPNAANALVGAVIV